MDRKKTILIAILINAGLLALLFVMGLYREEEVVEHVEVSRMLASDEGKQMPLFQGAVESLTEVATLQEIKPEVQQQVVHPLPPVVAAAPVTLAPMATAPAPAHVAKSNEVVVKQGDTMDKIAKAHHTSVHEILRLNQLTSSFLRVGQVLKLPSETASPAPKTKLIVPSDAKDEYYTVKVGDNPTAIALKHHMKVEDLLTINNLNEEKARRLKPGDRLRIK
jgi:LysM repeat protein